MKQFLVILAAISLKSEFKRRFTAFSGDISGRYFDVFSSYPAENNPIDLPKLMEEALQYQHPNGRFGNPDLVFDPEKHLPGYAACTFRPIREISSGYETNQRN